MSQSVATVIAALIAAFLGSIMGAYAALLRFRQEKAFDRQLEWYEKTIRSFHSMAERIEIACTFQREASTEHDQLQRVWRDVQAAHLALDRLALEALLYGSSHAEKLTRSVAEAVQQAANQSDAFDLSATSGQQRTKAFAAIEALTGTLYESAKPLALEARRHLGLR